MNKVILTIVAFMAMTLMLGPDITIARGGGAGAHSSTHSTRNSSGHSPSKSSSKSSKHVSSGTHHGGRQKATGVNRDKHGKIARSEKAKDLFKKKNPCPSTGKTSGACPGYVIDHTVTLKRGGKDEPSNMQWQTKADAKAKDKIE